jgi:dynein heavy chain
MTSDFKVLTAKWTMGSFIELEANDVETQVTNWWTASYRLMKQFDEENPGAALVAGKLRENSDQFRKYLPIIRSLASPALRERHWALLSDLIQVDVVPDEALTLQQLLDLNIMDHWEQVEGITVVAEKEFALETAIR